MIPLICKSCQAIVMAPSYPGLTRLLPFHCGPFHANECHCEGSPHPRQWIVTTQLETIFMPMQIYVPPEEARHFEINDIKVGKNSQLAPSAAIPAELFAQETNPTIMMDAISHGHHFTFNITCYAETRIHFNIYGRTPK